MVPITPKDMKEAEKYVLMVLDGEYSESITHWRNMNPPAQEYAQELWKDHFEMKKEEVLLG